MNQWIYVSISKQKMACYLGEQGQKTTLWQTYAVSTAKNGPGERLNSECTPRGWHAVHSILGRAQVENSVFVSRLWTGEIYSPNLAAQFPNRDWILTRIIRLEGLEVGLNKGEGIDSFARYIYIHGTPDTTELGKPGSRGCIRMNNKNMIKLANWVAVGTRILIE